MIVTMHHTPHGLLMALCDSSLLGQKISEETLQLDLTGRFYHGEEKTKEEVKKIIKIAYNINAVGEESIALLLEEGLVSKEGVKRIKNVPYTSCVLLQNEV